MENNQMSGAHTHGGLLGSRTQKGFQRQPRGRESVGRTPPGTPGDRARVDVCRGQSLRRHDADSRGSPGSWGSSPLLYTASHGINGSRSGRSRGGGGVGGDTTDRVEPTLLNSLSLSHSPMRHHVVLLVCPSPPFTEGHRTRCPTVKPHCSVRAPGLPVHAPRGGAREPRLL